jgi:hypothetical protein
MVCVCITPLPPLSHTDIVMFIFGHSVKVATSEVHHLAFFATHLTFFATHLTFFATHLTFFY